MKNNNLFMLIILSILSSACTLSQNKITIIEEQIQGQWILENTTVLKREGIYITILEESFLFDSIFFSKDAYRLFSHPQKSELVEEKGRFRITSAKELYLGNRAISFPIRDSVILKDYCFEIVKVNNNSLKLKAMVSFSKNVNTSSKENWPFAPPKVEDLPEYIYIVGVFGRP